jgi:hypothetical protein
MKLAAIIERAAVDGVSVALSSAGTLKVSGDKAVVDRWVPEIRAHKQQIVAALQEAANVASSWLWRVCYSDRAPRELACSPPASRAEVMQRNPCAIAAESFEPTPRQPTAPMTADEDRAIRSWLAHIGETDPATITDTLTRCQQDADARAYFIGRAQEVTQPAPPEDDRRTCDKLLEPAGARVQRCQSWRACGGTARV